tara:strand:- start:435 stop:962 length:528 start_codon:yes stop_codon:yes gene_type:complete
MYARERNLKRGEKMNKFKIIMILAMLSTITGCSETSGLFGKPGEGNDPFAEISKSSLDYFSSNVGDTTLFKVNQSVIEPEYRALLDSQAKWIKENSIASVTIEGHADEQGTREYNLALGARRATAVRNYLVSKGISDSVLSVVTYGKERPLRICSEESCWSKNRRAITIIKGVSS